MVPFTLKVLNFVCKEFCNRQKNKYISRGNFKTFRRYLILQFWDFDVHDFGKAKKKTHF